MGLRSTDDRVETCQNCDFAKPAFYEQIICGKDGKWYPQLYSCPRIRIDGKPICDTDGMK